MTQIKKLTKGPEATAEALRLLEPYNVLWRTPEFQKWVEGMTGELRYLDNLKWSAHVNPTAVETKVLSRMGVSSPTTREDQFEVFKAVRAVVNYVTSHLEDVRKAAEDCERLKTEELRRDNG